MCIRTVIAVTPSGSVALSTFDQVGSADDTDRNDLEVGPGGAQLGLFAGPPIVEPSTAR